MGQRSCEKEETQGMEDRIMGVHFKTFLTAFDSVIETANRKGKSIISSHKESYLNSCNDATRILKAESNNYASAKKGLRELREIRSKFPGKRLCLIESAASAATVVVDKVEELRISLVGYKKLLAEAEENEAHIEKCAKEVRKDYDAVRSMIKKGIIEKLEYDEVKGMSWTYPPMTYMHGGDRLFLGRPQCGLTRGGAGFTVAFPSYKSENVGTLHCSNSPGRQTFCLGGYEKIMYSLAAKKRLADMILVFKDWLGSYNPDSRYSNPEVSLMCLADPKVQDDSYEAWLKTKEGKIYVNLCTTVNT